MCCKGSRNGRPTIGTTTRPDINASNDASQRGESFRLRPDWDEHFLNLAREGSKRADCKRRQVYAIIVDSDHRQVEAGYNGAPPGKPGCLTANACPRAQTDVARYTNYDNCIAIHAEANALIKAGRRSEGCTMYITERPCVGCYKLIMAAGIKRVVTPRARYYFK